MGAFDIVINRQSVPPRLMDDTAPSDAELAPVFEAAVTAPDHGALRPWQFLTIRGAARERLGDLFVAAQRQRDPGADPEALEATRQKPLRAPLIIAVCAKVTEDHPKVPPIEQVVSAAAAAQNILIALDAMGYGAILLTGANAHDPVVKAGLGLAGPDAVVGFIYVGRPREGQRVKRRPEAASYVRSWDGPLDVAAE